MREIKGQGVLRHVFHGSYQAVIGVEFATAEDAALAATTLPGWQVSKRANVLVWAGNSEALDEVKQRLHVEIPPCGFDHCAHQCRNASIDSLAHSLDFGPRFILTVTVRDPRQGDLF